MEILGHHEARKLLSSIDKNKSHSFLLEGIKGIGKFGLAEKLATEILENEIRVKERSHPDFLLVQRKWDEKAGKKKSAIIVEDARKVGEFLSLTPAEGDFRVVIIDSADELNNQAANAILKIVEEPPKRSVIFLLSHGKHVLPTIRSRCVDVKLKPLNDNEMGQVIDNLIPDASANDKELLMQVAEGSPGMAKKLYENDGLWILHELVEIFSNFKMIDYPRLTKFAERINKNPRGWFIYKLILSWLVANIAKASARGGRFEIAGNDVSDIQHWPLFLEKDKEWGEIALNTEIYNLDQKQIIVNSLHGFKECYS